MSGKNELDFMSGIYKCYGDVQFLRLMVRLEMVKSSAIPLSNVDERETGVEPQHNEREEREFAWREKVFSRREREYYGDERNCTSSTERRYHEAIHASPAGSVNGRLSNYVAEDRMTPNLQRSLLYKEENSYFVKEDNISDMFQHRLHVSPVKALDYSSIPVKNIVDCNPTEELRIRNRTLFSGYEIMYIVADLSNRNSVDDVNEHLLVTVKWDERTRTLIVTPDFAPFDTTGYKTEPDAASDGRYTYRYWIANASNDGIDVEKLTTEIRAYQSKLGHYLDFDVPSKNLMDVFMFVNIKKAVGFTYDNQFIQYHIHLPDGWSTESDSLSGTTQKCRFGKMENTVMFSCIFEIKLTLNIEDISKTDEELISNLSLPQMFFEVCSIDSWNRLRVEGYTWTSLPSDPGRHRLILNTWRPAPKNPTDELRRYFIGSTPQISDFSYPGIPYVHESGLLSKYGFETVTSGDIFIEMNIIHQIGNAAPTGRKNSHMLSHLKASSLVKSVNHILESFKKARQRMLIAREPISFGNEGRITALPAFGYSGCGFPLCKLEMETADEAEKPDSLQKE